MFVTKYIAIEAKKEIFLYIVLRSFCDPKWINHRNLTESSTWKLTRIINIETMMSELDIGYSFLGNRQRK